MKIGYAFQGARTASLNDQIDVICDQGVDEDRIQQDVDTRDNLIECILSPSGLYVRDGDILVVACESYIGDGGRQRRKVLKHIASRNCQIQVADGEPRLIETDEDIAAFLDRAVKKSRLDSGKILGKTKARGRPTKLKGLSDDVQMLLKAVWLDQRCQPQVAIELTSMMLTTANDGDYVPVSRVNMNLWFGYRGKPKSTKP